MNLKEILRQYLIKSIIIDKDFDLSKEPIYDTEPFIKTYITYDGKKYNLSDTLKGANISEMPKLILQMKKK